MKKKKKVEIRQEARLDPRALSLQPLLVYLCVCVCVCAAGLSALFTGLSDVRMEAVRNANCDNISVWRKMKKKRPSRLPAAAADQGGGPGHATVRRQETLSLPP